MQHLFTIFKKKEISSSLPNIDSILMNNVDELFAIHKHQLPL